MLVRRILTSLSRQDWEAAAIELAIVVVGIFLGLQASSWYEDRQELALEDEILNRLEEDFKEIHAEGVKAIETHQKIIDGLIVLQNALERGFLRAEDQDAVVYSLRNVLNADTGAGSSSTYEEVTSSGRLRVISDDSLVLLLGEYDERVAHSQPLFANFRLMQMEYEKDFHRHINFGVPAKVRANLYNTADIVDFDFDAMQKDSAFRQALIRMTTFQTYFQLWHAKTNAAAAEVLDHLSNTSQ